MFSMECMRWAADEPIAADRNKDCRMDRMTADSPLTEDKLYRLTAPRKAMYQGYRAFQSGRLCGYVYKEFANDGLCTMLPDLLVSPPSSEKVLYRSYLNRDLFMINVPICGHPQVMCLKSVRYKSWWRLIFVDTIMPSRAFRYLTVAQTLKGIGIDTPTVIAVVEEKCFFGVRRSFVLTEWCRNTVALQKYGAATAIRDLSQTESAERQEIIDCLAKLVRLLHQNKIFHLDLKPDNILLRKETPDLPSLILIDLDSVAIVRPRTPLLSTLLKLADLLILHHHFHPITQLKERIRFLTVYSGKELSRKSAGRARLLLLRPHAIIRLYKCLRSVNLIHGLARLLLCLRALR